MTQEPLVFEHHPVLVNEVLAGLNLRAHLRYVDGTVGGAGHALAILQANSDIQLTGLDQDAYALAVATDRLPSNVTLHQANYSTITTFFKQGEITGGILLDLGVSSPQLDHAERGFSFRHTGPLDMRMNQTEETLTAADWVNFKSEAVLVDCFKTYGEERLARPIAKAIIVAREEQLFASTTELAEVITNVYQRYRIREDQHPATRVFQALRIAVNQELTHLQKTLDHLIPLLAPGARVAIISFHSLEDRLVKRWIRQASQTCICPPGFPICRCQHIKTLRALSHKPITASLEEQRINPRARSAKLRIAERIC